MKLDVRTKIVLLFFANYLLLKRVQTMYEWLFILGITGLFLAAKQLKTGITLFGIFSVLYFLDHFIMHLTIGKASSFLAMLSIGGRMMMPAIMAGIYLFKTTSARELMNGLRRLRLPESLVLTLAVMFRFLPAIKKDLEEIHESLKIRGIFLNSWNKLKHPLRYAEYVLVPLVVSSTQSALDLTIATMTKAIGNRRERTAYLPEHFRAQDVICLISLIIIACCVELNV